jgi:hypothetical protein
MRNFKSYKLCVCIYTYNLIKVYDNRICFEYLFKKISFVKQENFKQIEKKTKMNLQTKNSKIYKW